MTENEEELTYEEAEAIQAKLEETFLSILNQPDDAADSLGEEDSGLSDDQRAVLQKLIEKEMPTPEEIIERAKIMDHNDKVQRKREEKLAKRREKQLHGAHKRRRK